MPQIHISIVQIFNHPVHNSIYIIRRNQQSKLINFRTTFPNSDEAGPLHPSGSAGGLITLLGLFLAFYLQTCKLWAVREADGSWTLRGSSPKGGALFAERLREAAREAETKQS